MSGFGNRNNGSQSQMMMVGVSLVASCCLMSVCAGAYYMYADAAQKAEDARLAAELAAAEVPEETTAPGGDLTGGLRKIKYGSASLVVDPKKCSNKSVWFEDSQENDQHLWSFLPVPNKPDTYYIQSEQKLFKKGCPTQYLTGPSDTACKGSATIDKPVYADRQYWKVVQSGDKYQLVNVACQNRRAGSYMISSGARTGNKDAKNRKANFTARAGTPYLIESA